MESRHLGGDIINVPYMPVEEAIRLVENYRKAMLLNPILDFGELLCIRRNIGSPGSAFGGRQCGFLGLNAHNHWDMNRTGYDNDIVVVSDLRGTPTFHSLYKPKDTSVVRDLDIDFDASRILFTSYLGTNNLFGVYEIQVPGARCLVQGAELKCTNGCESTAPSTKHQALRDWPWQKVFDVGFRVVPESN